MVMREAEPWRVPEENLELVNHVAERIHPSDPALSVWFQKYRREHAARLAHDLAIVRRHVAPTDHVLEYGAIPLLMTASMALLQYHINGLDIAPARFAEAIENLGLDVRRCDVETETLPFGDRTFDVVLFNELFEHLRINPIFTLRETYRVLKPDGSLLLSTPNLRSLRGIRNLLVHNLGHAASPAGYSQYEKLETIGHMGHVREYTTREVSEFVSRVGFEVQTIVFRGGHGAGLTGVAERILPRARPFFTLIARKRCARNSG